jgi:hypothetical protein
VSSWPQLREARTVYPARESGAVVRCGVSDLILANTSASLVFFFRQPLDDAKLADGLSQALARVPVFAGRLRAAGDRLEIVCAGGGAQLMTYDVDESIGEAIGRAAMPGTGLADHVDAPRARAGGDPLLTVRVSRLSDGGTALGCSWHHAVGDMQSFMLLMRAWSAAVEQGEPPQVRILEDPDAYLDQVLPAEGAGRTGFRLLDQQQQASLDADVEAAIRSSRTVQAYFGEAEVARMRRDAEAAAGRRLSANDVLCGHVVAAIRRLDEDTQARSLAMPVNIRRHAGIAPSVVGNLVGEIFLTCAPGSAPAAIAAQVRAAVDDFARSHLAFRASRAQLAELGPGRFGDVMPIGFDVPNRTFTFTNWSRFGLYDITFGGQRPVLFSPAARLQVPWTSLLTEGFGQAGYFLTISVPGRLAARLRGQDGRALLHRHREPADVLPELAGQVRKLI